MKIAYFKHRDRFNFSKDTFDIGHPLIWDKDQEDNHFLYRLFRRNETEHPIFYVYHRDFFLQNYPEYNEQDFFNHVWEIVKDHIERLRLKDNYSSSHPRHLIEKKKLQAFQNYLVNVDQWNTDKSKEMIIAEKETEIITLKAELAKTKEDLKEARSLESTDHINIADDHLQVVIDLFNQFQDLKLPNGKELMLSQTQSIWVKMICKYFKHAKRPINSETIRRYFPADKKRPGSKYSPVPSQFKLFKIVPAKIRS